MTLFTKKEKQVIIILIGVLIGGYGIKLYNQSNIYEGFSSISQKEKGKFKQIAENDFIESSIQSQNSKSSVNKSTSEKDYKPTQEIININTAQKKDLIKLPNVGKVTAKRIIMYRDDFGPFKPFKTGTDLF